MLGYRQKQQHNAPGLAQMVKDVYSPAISGVGRERTFSIVQQICTFQRNCLDESTIQQLANVRHHTKLYSAEQHRERLGTLTACLVTLTLCTMELLT